MSPLKYIDRRSALKLIGGAGAWPAFAPVVGLAQADIEPFKVHVPDEELAELRRRLSSIRWPPDATGKPWSMGTDRAYLQQLMAYWRDTYDWRVHEAALNAFSHHVTTIEGQKIHFIHQRSRHPSAMPLVMTHGYPGTLWEMLPSVPALVDPPTHGGTAADAFHVIVPSLPGFGFSGEPLDGSTPERIAELWVALMDKLGYRRFGAYGSDWGAGITTQLGTRFPDRLAGTAIPGPPPSRASREPRTPEERAYFESTERYAAEETGYQYIQGTKPQSLAYGLTDSPAGVAGWVVEKLRSWSDCRGDVERRFSKDQILTLASIYWHTRSIGTATRIYYATGRWRTPASARPAPPQPPAGGRRVPQGFFDFPGITSRARPPKSLVDKVPENVTLWSYHETGGHFPAIEEPKLLVEDLRTFFRPLRS